METGKRNEAFDCAVHSFAALEDYAGFSKPNDLLERIAKDLTSDEPKQKPQFGGYDPNKNPTPQSISPLREAQAPEKKLPRWMQNGRTPNREFDPRIF